MIGMVYGKAAFNAAFFMFFLSFSSKKYYFTLFFIYKIFYNYILNCYYNL